MRKTVFAFLFFLFSGYAGSAQAGDAPWGFWAKGEEAEPEYSGKPEIPKSGGIEKKREVEEDIRKHVQKELKNADLTTEGGRARWEERSREIRQERIEELNRQRLEPEENKAG